MAAAHRDLRGGSMIRDVTPKPERPLVPVFFAAARGTTTHRTSVRRTATGTHPTTGTTTTASALPARSKDGSGVMPCASGFARIAETTISASAQTSVQGRS
jgi:hypothetical protein